MLVCRTSPISGTYNRYEIDMTVDEYRAALKHWMAGGLIQDAFPNVAPWVREFIKTGITPAEWESVFNEKIA